MSANGHDSGSETARHTIRSVSLGTLFRAMRWPFMLLSMVFIPRVMQDETYGRYALFIAVYFMADMVTDVGILQVLGRFVPGPATPDQEDRRSSLLQGLLVAGTLLAVMVCVLVATFVLTFPFEWFPAKWLPPFCILLILTRIEGTLFGFVYGMNHIARYSLREVLRSLLLFAGVLFFFVHYGLIGAIWSLVIKEIILGMIAMYWTRHYLFRPRRLSWTALKPYLWFGLAFYLPLMLFGLLQRSGAIFIQAITQSSAHVGYFDLANQYFLMGVSFLGVILVTLLPSMSAYREAGEHAVIHRWHGNVMSFCGVVVFLVFNALVWFGEPVLALALGPEFLPVRKLALVMTLAMVPGLIIYLGINYSILEKEPRVYTRGVAAGIAAMAAACLLLIPRLQSTGAAWAAVFGHSVMAGYFCRRYREHFRSALDGFLKSLLIAACFVPTVWLTARWPWNLAWFAGTTGVYLAVVLMSGIVDRKVLRLVAAKGSSLIVGRNRAGPSSLE